VGFVIIERVLKELLWYAILFIYDQFFLHPLFIEQMKKKTFLSVSEYFGVRNVTAKR
jgi:hypothetical protein